MKPTRSQITPKGKKTVMWYPNEDLLSLRFCYDGDGIGADNVAFTWYCSPDRGNKLQQDDLGLNLRRYGVGLADCEKLNEVEKNNISIFCQAFVDRMKSRNEMNDAIQSQLKSAADSGLLSKDLQKAVEKMIKDK